MAGNQLGKTYAAGAEVAYHCTGDYPDWWDGYRFDRPTSGWAASESMEVSRDAGQRILLGRATSRGSGTIPREAILEMARYPNVTDAISIAKVRHKSGGISQIIFKSYDQGRTKFQGDTVDWVWFDEEPAADIYTEGLTRTNVGRRPVMLTFTPLKGVTDIVMSFLEKKEGLQKALVTMTIDDVDHYSAEEKVAIYESYPEHEREARTRGIPVMGSGRVFPIAESVITEGVIEIPSHWPRICGIDFGWDHPTAVAWLAYDRDSDTVHVYDAYRQREKGPIIHAAAIKSKGGWIPCAWPHDGNQETAAGAGAALSRQYAEQGVNVLREHATHPLRRDGKGGGFSLEAGVMEMLSRMQTGRLKIASHLTEWFEEYRLYHRDEGQIVKVRDDLLSATRYGLMMLRKASTEPAGEEDGGYFTEILDQDVGY